MGDSDFSNVLMDGHCLSPWTCRCCISFKKIDGLNFDGLAGKHQKRQNFALYNIRSHSNVMSSNYEW